MAPYIPLLILFVIGAVITVTFFTATRDRKSVV